MKKQKLFQHGDSKPKSSMKISGHMYNPSTGTIDTFIDGKFSHHLCQLHEPKPATKKTFVVGTTTKLNLNYSSGPSEWKQQSAVIVPKGK